MQEISLVGDFGCLELCLYGIRELEMQHHDLNQSEHSIWTDLDQWGSSTLIAGLTWTSPPSCSQHTRGWTRTGPPGPGPAWPTPGPRWAPSCSLLVAGGARWFPGLQRTSVCCESPLCSPSLARRPPWSWRLHRPGRSRLPCGDRGCAGGRDCSTGTDCVLPPPPSTPLVSTSSFLYPDLTRWNIKLYLVQFSQNLMSYYILKTRWLFLNHY